MKFSFTHHMQYDFAENSGNDWPVPNRLFDPDLGVPNYREHTDQKIFAEECGFDWVACNEHHMSPYGLMPNPSLIGAIVAHQTKRVGVLQSGSILPLNNPIRVAEEYAMIDVLSGGRLVAGFMRGIPHEYVAYNIDPGESYGRMYESIDLIKKCWTEPEPFDFNGRFWNGKAIKVRPEPYQRPHPPIAMACSDTRESAELAGERGSWILFGSTADPVYQRLVDYYNIVGGFGTLMFHMGRDYGSRRGRARSMRLFMEQVAPRLRTLNPD